MASKVARRQQAMAKARERRSALDQDRAARDRRVEEATAQVLLQLQERAAAQEAVQAVNAEIGVVLRRLLDDEGIAAQGVGSLVDLTVTQVRRLARAVPSSAPSPAGAWVVADEGTNRPGAGIWRRSRPSRASSTGLSACGQRTPLLERSLTDCAARPAGPASSSGPRAGPGGSELRACVTASSWLRRRCEPVVGGPARDGCCSIERARGAPMTDD